MRITAAEPEDFGMARDSRYDVLFEPVTIGPVIAKNRFYQVPHCTGMPHLVPRSLAAMREMKAEGGWAVVCTEACSIHPVIRRSILTPRQIVGSH